MWALIYACNAAHLGWEGHYYDVPHAAWIDGTLLRVGHYGTGRVKSDTAVYTADGCASTEETHAAVASRYCRSHTDRCQASRDLLQSSERVQTRERERERDREEIKENNVESESTGPCERQGRAMV